MIISLSCDVFNLLYICILFFFQNYVVFEMVKKLLLLQLITSISERKGQNWFRIPANHELYVFRICTENSLNQK